MPPGMVIPKQQFPECLQTGYLQAIELKSFAQVSEKFSL
jgi:hypothetical protein